MDNLPAHKIVGIRQKIEAAGAKCLYVPPYSPDCLLPGGQTCRLIGNQAPVWNQHRCDRVNFSVELREPWSHDVASTAHASQLARAPHVQKSMSSINLIANLRTRCETTI